MYHLQPFLNFIRDWLPSISIIIGGLWIFIRWIVDENRRKQREIPAIDGNVVIQQHLMSNGKALIAVNTTWNNKGVYPIHIDVNLTNVRIYLIPADVPFGALIINSGEDEQDLLGKASCISFPYKQYDSFYLEPNTSSLLQNHFIVETGNTYLVVCELYKKVEKNDMDTTIWTRETITSFQ